MGIYNNLIKHFDNEFNVLLNVGEADLEEVAGKNISKAIIAIRTGSYKIIEGSDGVYGKLKN